MKFDLILLKMFRPVSKPLDQIGLVSPNPKIKDLEEESNLNP
jgi:hypothetical protein